MKVSTWLSKQPERVIRRIAALSKKPLAYKVSASPQGRPKVLICGIYIAEKPNSAEHLVTAFASAKGLDVEQRWVCMRGVPPTPAVAAVTVQTLTDYKPKWVALSEIVGEKPWETFDFVIFTDDDIFVGDGFLDHFVGLQQRYDFSLAQPARSLRSWNAWSIVRQRFFGIARESNFVESGPMVSMDKRFLQLVMPFDLESAMGWGYDHVWPVLAHKAGLKLGIIDATAVDHTMRQQFVTYKASTELANMVAYLGKREHYGPKKLNRTVRRHFS